MTLDRIKRPALVGVSAFALSALASPTLAQDRDARERIAALSSPDVVARAMAACELGRMRAADVQSAREPLLALIGDAAPVEPRLCRDWDNGRGPDEPSSPGREAAIALEELGTDVLPALTQLLRDSRPPAREQAAFALGLIESEQSIEPLARVLGDREARVRSRAAWGLGMIESTRGVEPLLGVLGDDSDWQVREQAAWALGMIESSTGVEGLADAAADADPRVREQVAWALGMIESASGGAPLERLLRDREAEVRQQAAWALGMIESAGAVDSLIQALADREPRVREQAAWALGMIESASAAEAVAGALERETDAEVRRQLVWALGRVIDSADLDVEPSALAALLRKALLAE
jgi:HEAT repeat protein